MSNEKKSVFSIKIGRRARIFIRFVTAVYVIAGAICAGLFMNVFGFIDSVNSYILAEELLHSMIRSTVAATMMTLLIDLLAGND